MLSVMRIFRNIKAGVDQGMYKYKCKFMLPLVSKIFIPAYILWVHIFPVNIYLYIDINKLLFEYKLDEAKCSTRV